MLSLGKPLILNGFLVCYLHQLEFEGVEFLLVILVLIIFLSVALDALEVRVIIKISVVKVLIIFHSTLDLHKVRILRVLSELYLI